VYRVNFRNLRYSSPLHHVNALTVRFEGYCFLVGNIRLQLVALLWLVPEVLSCSIYWDMLSYMRNLSNAVVGADVQTCSDQHHEFCN